MRYRENQAFEPRCVNLFAQGRLEVYNLTKAAACSSALSNHKDDIVTLCSGHRVSPGPAEGQACKASHRVASPAKGGSPPMPFEIF